MPSSETCLGSPGDITSDTTQQVTPGGTPPFRRSVAKGSVKRFLPPRDLLARGSTMFDQGNEYNSTSYRTSLQGAIESRSNLRRACGKNQSRHLDSAWDRSCSGLGGAGPGFPVFHCLHG